MRRFSEMVILRFRLLSNLGSPLLVSLFSQGGACRGDVLKILVVVSTRQVTSPSSEWSLLAVFQSRKAWQELRVRYLRPQARRD
jgi:hypothetical protein